MKEREDDKDEKTSRMKNKGRKKKRSGFGDGILTFEF